MNEITKIHLGRQAFTISVDAYKALQEYLHAIARQVGGKDVAEEVELRMAELLTERGVTGDKVILPKDVAYLKEQLGEPGDFGDEESEKKADDASASKRLFRDTEHGMLAGVCAGIAKYFSVDPLWVRLAFIGLVFAGASGVLLYIILWLIVPEAKTGSERLQMQGKPVTVDALKDVVDRADVKGVAKRAGNVASKAVQSVLKVMLAVMGVGLMIGAIGAILGLAIVSIYWSLNHDLVPGHIFPIGASETVLLCVSLLFMLMIALFLLVGGLAMVKRKWPLPGWGLGAMVAIALASLAVGAALSADAAPRIRDRYEAANHTYTRSVPEFHKLNVVGGTDVIRYEEAPAYAVIVKYWGDVDVSKIEAVVKDQTLSFDARTLARETQCQRLCLFQSPIREVIIQGPKLQEVVADMAGTQLEIPGVSNQTIKVRSLMGSVYFGGVAADTVKAERATDGTWTLTFAGAYKGDLYRGQEVSIFEKRAGIMAKNITLTYGEQCGAMADIDANNYVYVDGSFEFMSVNGKVAHGLKETGDWYTPIGPNAYKCIQTQPSYGESTPAPN